MTNRPKQIGTATETAVVRYARTVGFGGAERVALHGSADIGDLRFCPGAMGEVKGGHAAETASDAQISKWLDETERERVNAGAAIGILITKRKGVGAANAGQWWAHVRLGTICLLTNSVAPHEGLSLEQRTYVLSMPVRLVLADMLTLLRAAGYGDPLADGAR